MTLSVLLFVLSLGQFSQVNTGDLRIAVADPAGLPLQCVVEVVSLANQVRQQLTTDAQGVVVVRRLPFGAYQVTVSRDGFSASTGVVDVRSAVPAEYRVALAVAPVATQLTVTTDQPLVDPRQTAPVNRIGADTLRQRTTALPGRALADLVNTQPGWLLEANGILHPRASEYQAQYVVDGLPFTDNRSPAFAPEIGSDDVQALNIRTGGYPAEYGRKLGGVIEVVTTAQPRQGFHGQASGSAGSFGTFGGDLIVEQGWTATT